MKNEQTHLVPLVKSAVSVNKGLVVRTYHVTPERLKKYIEENKNRFSTVLRGVLNENFFKSLEIS
jgi:hypothetical protein